MSIRDAIQNFVSGNQQKGSARYYEGGDKIKDTADPRGKLKPKDFDTNSHTRASDLMVENFLKVNWDAGDVAGEAKSDWDLPERRWIRYEDPTVLSFRVFFDFISADSPLLLGLTNNQTELSKDEYTKADIEAITTPNSALRYLLLIGEVERARYLIAFQELLKKMSQLSPWFFQSLEGLEDAWKHGFEDDEFKAFVGKESKITINTLDEAVDLRITALIDFYRKACFDWLNRREMVPRNLRFFNVRIYVHEARFINLYGDSANPAKHTTRADGDNQFLYARTLRNYESHAKAFGIDPDTESPDLTTGQRQRENNEISRILFYFYYCEWLPDESVGTLSGLSNKELGIKSQKLVFSYGNVHEVNQYRLFHDRAVTDAFVGVIGKSIEDFKNANTSEIFKGDAWPAQPALASSQGFFSYLGDKAMNWAKDKAEKYSNFIFGAKKDRIGKVYPPTLLEKALEKLGMEEVGDSPLAQATVRRAMAELEKAEFVNKFQQFMVGNVYGFIPGKYKDFSTNGINGKGPSKSPAMLISQASSINGIVDALNLEGLESNASMKNDDGNDASGANGMGQVIGRKVTAIEGQSIYDPKSPSLTLDYNTSKSNDNGSDADKINKFVAQYTDANNNKIGITYGADNDPSKTNDNGPDARNDPEKANKFVAGYKNDSNKFIEITYGADKDPSKTNDNGPDASGAAPFKAGYLSEKKAASSTLGGKEFIPITYGADKDPSKTNDNGMDASSKKEKGEEPLPDPQISLTNKTKVLKADAEFLYGGGASLTNDNGMDASSINKKGEEPLPDPQISIKNDKGLDSLKANEFSAKKELLYGGGDSLTNDNGMDASSKNKKGEEPLPNPQISITNKTKVLKADAEFLYGGGDSLTNDNGMDAKGEAPVDSQTSLKNDKGMDASNEAPVDSQTSLKNDKGMDAKGEAPVDSQTSLKNDKGMDASNEAPVDSQSSLKNDKGMDAKGEAPVDPQTSLKNDKGMDASSESPVDPQSSLKNDKGPDASNEAPVDPQTSLKNDKGMDASSESPVDSQTSLKNDKGPDASNEAPIDSQSSLKNDKGMDAKGESPVDSQSSLKNDKGPDSSNEAPVDPQSSLKNDKGPDASNEAPVDSQTSLKNDKGMDASNEAPVDPQSSLKNDKGPDASNEAPANSQISLKNDKGMDASSESPVDPQSSLKNDKGPDASNEAPVDPQTSLKNDKGMDASNEAPVDPQTSLKNDKGMDASSEAPVDPQSSLKNDKGMDASNESPVNPQSSLKNDKGPDSKVTEPVDSQSSLKNDKGPDSKETPTVDSQSSLKNDKGPDSTNTEPGIEKNSLNNYKGPDSTETPNGDSQSSLKNDKGPDSTNTEPAKDNTSLGNNKNPGASDVIPGNPLASLLNDKGPDSSETPTSTPNVSLKNDNGPDGKGTQPGDNDISMINGE